MFHPRSSLASSLLLLSLGACALSACFLSQEDQILNNPPQRNRPPRIMEEQPIMQDSLALGRKITIDTDCPTLEFRFKAEDPDVDQPLRVLWYIDYPLFTGNALEQVLNSNGQTVRSDEGSFSVDLTNPSLGFPARSLQQIGTHVVEALLFDGVLDAQRKPLPLDPALDGGIPNPSYVVSYGWVVETLRTCPP